MIPFPSVESIKTCDLLSYRGGSRGPSGPKNKIHEMEEPKKYNCRVMVMMMMSEYYV